MPLIGHMVHEDDEMWQCLKVSTCRIQSPGLVGYLEVLVSDHHHLFIRCYPGYNVTQSSTTVFTYLHRSSGMYALVASSAPL